MHRPTQVRLAQARDHAACQAIGVGELVRFPAYRMRKDREPWIDKDELAEYLGRSTRWIELRMRDSGLPHHKGERSRLVRFRISDVDEWLAATGLGHLPRSSRLPSASGPADKERRRGESRPPSLGTDAPASARPVRSRTPEPDVGRLVAFPADRQGPEPWHTKQQIADYLERSVRWVEGRMRDEGLPYHKDSRSRFVRFRLSEIDAWLGSTGRTRRPRTRPDWLTGA
jgi:predicted DNA-binding transcriptional regulator AlpA